MLYYHYHHVQCYRHLYQQNLRSMFFFTVAMMSTIGWYTITSNVKLISVISTFIDS